MRKTYNKPTTVTVISASNVLMQNSGNGNPDINKEDAKEENPDDIDAKKHGLWNTEW